MLVFLLIVLLAILAAFFKSELLRDCALVFCERLEVEVYRFWNAAHDTLELVAWIFYTLIAAACVSLIFYWIVSIWINAF